jgi:hypothetical protein
MIDSDGPAMLRRNNAGGPTFGWRGQRDDIRIYRQIAVVFAPVREFLLGPFMVTAPLRRHLGHNPAGFFDPGGRHTALAMQYARVTGR